MGSPPQLDSEFVLLPGSCTTCSTGRTGLVAAAERTVDQEAAARDHRERRDQTEAEQEPPSALALWGLMRRGIVLRGIVLRGMLLRRKELRGMLLRGIVLLCMRHRQRLHLARRPDRAVPERLSVRQRRRATERAADVCEWK
ncbi:hypothetical protein ARNL5_01959 [Anaerolineae bacterium]|nr:hypothetical protein ARNL5_01959 [Anaerolineae bacterium]